MDIKGVTGVGSVLTVSMSFLARSFVVTGNLETTGPGASYTVNTVDTLKYVKIFTVERNSFDQAFDFKILIELLMYLFDSVLDRWVR